MHALALTLLCTLAPEPTVAVGMPSVPQGESIQQDAETGLSKLTWYGDLDEARKVAAAEGKHVLVSFTGTGWCSWCRKLDAEVIDTDLFAEAVAARFVLVRVDFDASGAARKDLPFAEKNNALKKGLGVTGFPTVALMTAEGVGYAKMGYERGGAGKYVEALASQHGKASYLEKEVPKATAAIARAKSKEEAAAAGAHITALLKEAGPHALGQPLVPLVRATLAGAGLEPKREAEALMALVSANVVDDELINRAFRVDPKNEVGLPEAALAAAMRTLDGPESVEPLIKRTEAMLETLIVHDPQVAAQLYGDCAYWIKHWQRDDARARMMASFALRLKPKDEVLRGMLRDLAGR